jgi:hypothetical protein
MLPTRPLFEAASLHLWDRLSNLPGSGLAHVAGPIAEAVEKVALPSELSRAVAMRKAV